jgi:hydroxymethylpyrimidine/phosphomethylpyrimidine kinase
MTAQTALTAQNTLGVRRIYRVPSAFVREQIDAVLEDIGVDVVKTGIADIERTSRVGLTWNRNACVGGYDRGCCRCVEEVRYSVLCR